MDNPTSAQVSSHQQINIGRPRYYTTDVDGNVSSFHPFDPPPLPPRQPPVNNHKQGNKILFIVIALFGMVAIVACCLGIAALTKGKVAEVDERCQFNKVKQSEEYNNLSAIVIEEFKRLGKQSEEQYNSIKKVVQELEKEREEQRNLSKQIREELIGLENKMEKESERQSNLSNRIIQEVNRIGNKTNSLGELFPQTCEDFLPSQGVGKNGIYTIYPYGNGDMTQLWVYCDLKTDGGGWIVFQKRVDGSENFYRNFNDYVKGFGRLNGEFWLGLDALHKLTKDGEYEMRVDMEDFENQTRYALYRDFVVGVGTDYTMTVGKYSGTAGSALRSARFSAKDRDQDTNSGSCAQKYKGGWWYKSCHTANPNGLYLRGSHESFADGVEWKPFRGYHYSLKRIEMKLRKK